jgi:hypothetical protein
MCQRFNFALGRHTPRVPAPFSGPGTFPCAGGTTAMSPTSADDARTVTASRALWQWEFLLMVD